MTQPLRGKRILVTRPTGQAAELAARITALGGEALCFPLIEIDEPACRDDLEAAARHLDHFVLAIFISPNAVAYALPCLLAARAWPANVRAAAIGPGTARCLGASGVADVLVPVGSYDSEALLALEPLQAAAVAGRRVLILRGDGGRELLAETLRARGAIVECVTCYRRCAPRHADVVVSWLHNRQLDAVTLSSSEGLRNLFDLLDTEARACLSGLPVFVPHRRIAEEAVRCGLRRVVLSAPADEGLVAALSNFSWT